MITDVDFVAWDNSDPPQLWAWAGTYGDESAEPLFRLPGESLLSEWQEMKSEISNLQTELDKRKAEWACLFDQNRRLREDSHQKTTDVERLTEELKTVTDLIDDILYDPHWKPVDEWGQVIRGNATYLLDHPVQEQHMPALREWFVARYTSLASRD